MFSSKSFMFLCLDLYFESFLYMISGRAHNKLWKILKEMGIQDHLTCLQREVKKQHFELDMEQWISSKLGKEYIQAEYCHPVYLTYVQSTSCEMPGWMKRKLESRLPGEISTTSDMQIIPP